LEKEVLNEKKKDFEDEKKVGRNKVEDSVGLLSIF